MENENDKQHGLTLSLLPLPAKALITGVLITLSLGMAGAMGQIIIHDIIPTFFSGQEKGGGHGEMGHHSNTPGNLPETVKEDEDFFADMDNTGKSDADTSMERGDLFADAPVHAEPAKEKPFYKKEQFIWTLKWTHIHLFGINMIFIILGTVTFMLNMSEKSRTWLISLPFLGIFIDIAAMWLKGFVSPAFFWLHIPGGGIFGLIFLYVFFRAFWEMWFCSVKR